MHDSIRTIQTLHKQDVHLVLCRSQDEGNKKAKSAIEARWQSKSVALKRVVLCGEEPRSLHNLIGMSIASRVEIDDAQRLTAHLDYVGRRVPLIVVVMRGVPGAGSLILLCESRYRLTAAVRFRWRGWGRCSIPNTWRIGSLGFIGLFRWWCSIPNTFQVFVHSGNANSDHLRDLALAGFAGDVRGGTLRRNMKKRDEELQKNSIENW